MTLQERIDEMYRQLETTNQKSKQKIRDLKRGIERAKRQKRRELRGGTIIIWRTRQEVMHRRCRQEHRCQSANRQRTIGRFHRLCSSLSLKKRSPSMIWKARRSQHSKWKMNNNKISLCDLKALCEQKIKDEQLTEQQRNAWQNALKSVEIQIEIMTPKQLKLFDY